MEFGIGVEAKEKAPESRETSVAEISDGQLSLRLGDLCLCVCKLTCVASGSSCCGTRGTVCGPVVGPVVGAGKGAAKEQQSVELATSLLGCP